jgi:phosphoglycerate dehydrogenase-like enzyme
MRAAMGSEAKDLLSYRFRVLSFESQEEFDALQADYRRAFAPRTRFENLLVDDMAEAHWRVVRFQRVEEQVASDPTALKKIHRFTTEARRIWRQAEKHLRDVRPRVVRRRRSPAESPERALLRQMVVEGRLPPARPQNSLETLFGNSDPFAPRA